MSGIITGPQFKAYFKQPDSYHIGTMVAILKVGVFSKSHLLPLTSRPFGSPACSYVHSCRTRRRHHRPTQNTVFRRSCLCRRRCHPNLHHWLRSHGPGTNLQWLWRWSSIVSLRPSLNALGSKLSNERYPNRTIVPIHQSEISPAEHGSLHLLHLGRSVEWD